MVGSEVQNCKNLSGLEKYRRQNARFWGSLGISVQDENTTFLAPVSGGSLCRIIHVSGPKRVPKRVKNTVFRVKNSCFSDFSKRKVPLNLPSLAPSFQKKSKIIKKVENV